MSQVAIIGSGLIGRAWAIVFARAGWDVALFDAVPDAAKRAKDLVAAGLDELASYKLVADPKGAAARVRIASALADALEGASFVQENISETVEAKRAIFAELDRIARPDAILASSTSAIIASLFTENLSGRHRCLVAHPVNPPHLVPLVELVASPWTGPETISAAKQVYETIGQVPIVARREIEGFVLNRLQGALLAEAFRLVGDGYVSPQDLDKTLKDGLGLRWSFMGPFETIELNAPGGASDYCARYTGFYQRLQSEPASREVYAPANVEKILAQWGPTPPPEELAKRTQWRDRRLAALAAHKKGQPEL
ncbi:MAG TPA: 3-hydroxyacyl-CoA dehydrogenase [Xanthobacteraceae bacterium]|jgi:3-hydroxyacyl-CoA dehydrogenase|nr:3-hydroxyacyl-CoA dehydrogenase [Xanthobacteraceae bacterium]